MKHSYCCYHWIWNFPCRIDTHYGFCNTFRTKLIVKRNAWSKIRCVFDRHKNDDIIAIVICIFYNLSTKARVTFDYNNQAIIYFMIQLTSRYHVLQNICVSLHAIDMFRKLVFEYFYIKIQIMREQFFFLEFVLNFNDLGMSSLK